MASRAAHVPQSLETLDALAATTREYRLVMREFDGKIAVVTGGAHGFGRAISIALAERGASVWSCDVIEEELAETARQCGARGGACAVRVVDVRDRSSCTGIRRTPRPRRPARVDILVNNAGSVLAPGAAIPRRRLRRKNGRSIFRSRERDGRILLRSSRGAWYEGRARWAHH